MPRFTSAAVLVALALTAGQARATGGGDTEIDDYESFFAPEIIGSPAEEPFFLTGHRFYQSDDGGSLPMETLEAINAKEWSAHFSGKVALANLNILIYKMPLAELDKLIWTTEGKKAQAQGLSAKSAQIKAELDAVGNKTQVLQALYYLGFAKRCEPIAMRRVNEDPWDAQKFADATAGDAATTAKLLDGSLGLLRSTSDKFLLERYHFQRMRLLFYAARYSEAEQYYTSNIGAFATESSVKYRFVNAAAGSFYHDKKYGQANYLYSLIFDRFAPLKNSVFLSFNPSEDADWKQSLSLAKSTREKTVLWQLLGIRDDGMAAIEKIYGLDPASNLLPLLLMREVSKTEQDAALGKSASNYSSAEKNRASARVIGKKRLGLLKRIADEKKAFKPYLWQLAVGHIYALIGDTKSSLAYLDLAEKSMPLDAAQAPPTTVSIRGQIRMSRLFAKAASWKAVDRTQEAFVVQELAWLQSSKERRAAELSGWVTRKLRELYTRAGDIPQYVIAGDYGSSRKIDAILAFLDRPGKSPLVELLSSAVTKPKAELIAMKALNELYAGRFKGAADLLAQAGPEVGNRALLADPFMIHIVDCHDCDFVAKKKVSYTLATFVKKMLELSNQVERPGEAGAQASLLLANGLYNMTYYGNARDVYNPTSSDDAARNRDMTLAAKYYKRAMELSADKEFKAKACFMSAKAEQNRFFEKPPVNGVKYNGSELDPVHSPIYFKKLKDSFANTRYYQDVIRECGYFRSYLKR